MVEFSGSMGFESGFDMNWLLLNKGSLNGRGLSEPWKLTEPSVCLTTQCVSTEPGSAGAVPFKPVGPWPDDEPFKDLQPCIRLNESGERYQVKVYNSEPTVETVPVSDQCPTLQIDTQYEWLVIDNRKNSKGSVYRLIEWAELGELYLIPESPAEDDIVTELVPQVQFYWAFREVGAEDLHVVLNREITLARQKVAEIRFTPQQVFELLQEKLERIIRIYGGLLPYYSRPNWQVNNHVRQSARGGGDKGGDKTGKKKGKTSETEKLKDMYGNIKEKGDPVAGSRRSESKANNEKQSTRQTRSSSKPTETKNAEKKNVERKARAKTKRRKHVKPSEVALADAAEEFDIPRGILMADGFENLPQDLRSSPWYKVAKAFLDLRDRGVFWSKYITPIDKLFSSGEAKELYEEGESALVNAIVERFPYVGDQLIESAQNEPLSDEQVHNDLASGLVTDTLMFKLLAALVDQIMIIHGFEDFDWRNAIFERVHVVVVHTENDDRQDGSEDVVTGSALTVGSQMTDIGSNGGERRSEELSDVHAPDSRVTEESGSIDTGVNGHSGSTSHQEDPELPSANTLDENNVQNGVENTPPEEMSTELVPVPPSGITHSDQPSTSQHVDEGDPERNREDEVRDGNVEPMVDSRSENETPTTENPVSSGATVTTQPPTALTVNSPRNSPSPDESVHENEGGLTVTTEEPSTSNVENMDTTDAAAASTSGETGDSVGNNRKRTRSETARDEDDDPEESEDESGPPEPMETVLWASLNEMTSDSFFASLSESYEIACPEGEGNPFNSGMFKRLACHTMKTFLTGLRANDREGPPKTKRPKKHKKK